MQKINNQCKNLCTYHMQEECGNRYINHKTNYIV